MGRGSLDGRAVRRDNDYEYSGLLPCVPPHLNPLPRGGEEVWTDAQSGEATTMSILGYFRARPLTSILSPEGRGSLGGRAIW